MDGPTVLVLPLAGGVLGWLANRLALESLFRPRRRVRLLGLELQGTIHRHREELVMRLAEAVDAELVGAEDVSRLVAELDWEEEVGLLLDKAVEDGFRTPLGRIPVLGALADGLLGQARAAICRETARALDRHREHLAGRISSRLDVRRLVADKLGSLEPARLEGAVRGILSRPLRRVELAGALSGMALGSLLALMEVLL